MKPTLYAWNFGGARGDALAAVCRENGFALCRVSPSQTGIPLGKLVDSRPAPGPAVMPFPEEMLLMAGFRDDQVDALLRGLRETGLAPIPLKAVLTPFNAMWDSVRLRRELTREAQHFAGK